MRYSSHLYLRFDGTLGRFPIIEVDEHGVIVNIEECGETLTERAGTRFYAGVIVASREDDGEMTFDGKEDFLEKMRGREVLLGAQRGLTLISGLDLNSFKGDSIEERQLTKKLHIS